MKVVFKGTFDECLEFEREHPRDYISMQIVNDYKDGVWHCAVLAST